MGRDEFERMWSEHARPLLGFLVYRTGDVALAEDLVADTFERALRARRRFDPRKGSEKNWIYAIALNLLRDRQRRSAVESKALERIGASEPDLEGSFTESVEARDAIARAMAALTPEERDAVSLRYGGGLTVPEVARALGEPLKRVEGRILRALAKLRDQLPPEGTR